MESYFLVIGGIEIQQQVSGEFMVKVHVANSGVIYHAANVDHERHHTHIYLMLNDHGIINISFNVMGGGAQLSFCH